MQDRVKSTSNEIIGVVRPTYKRHGNCYCDTTSPNCKQSADVKDQPGVVTERRRCRLVGDSLGDENGQRYIGKGLY